MQNRMSPQKAVKKGHGDATFPARKRPVSFRSYWLIGFRVPGTRLLSTESGPHNQEIKHLTQRAQSAGPQALRPRAVPSEFQSAPVLVLGGTGGSESCRGPQSSPGSRRETRQTWHMAVFYRQEITAPIGRKIREELTDLNVTFNENNNNKKIVAVVMVGSKVGFI